MINKSKKLLIWDGDETLWNGTITASDNITLTSGRYELCEKLHSIGCLQSIASKNLLTDIDKTLHKFGLSQFFLANQADFNRSKSEMILNCMTELGLVNKSDVLFIDDQEFNIQEVRSSIGVESLNIKDIESDLDILKYFQKEYYTEEDINRVSSYRSEIARKEASKSYSTDKIKFFESCDMKMSIRLGTTYDLKRIYQLVERANQLAASNKPYSKYDINELVARSGLYIISCSDKYGDYGLSGVAGLEKLESNSINLLVISCRLQGKGYGSALLGWLINNLGVYSAEWVETEYNSGVRALYEWYKFDITKEKYRCYAKINQKTNQMNQPTFHIQSKTIKVSLPHWISITLE